MPLQKIDIKTLIFVGLLATVAAVACNQKSNPAKIKDKSDFTGFRNVPIDTTRRQVGACEPSIYINPTNPKNIVAGSVLDNVYWSKDGGETWQRKQLTSTHGVYGDPVILADYQGNFFFAHLSDPDHKGWSSPRLLDRMVVQKSTDGGETWSDGGFAGLHHPKDQDKQWLAADPKSHHLYMTWTEFDKYESEDPNDKSRILFAKSTDSGETWTETVAISQFEGNCLDDDRTTEGAVPAVGNNGEIYVVWSFAEKIYFDRSLDGGKTWLDEDIVVAEQPGGWNYEIPGIMRCNGMPVLAVAPNGTIYVNWSDQRNGEDDTDIWLAHSTDGGKTWSKPKRINDDGKGKHQFLTWMAIDPTDGAIYTVFYDRRAYDDAKTDVYLAYSFDDGKTFKNMRISEQPFQPNTFGFFGDYNNISAYNGVIRPIWTRMDGLRLGVWTALINRNK